MVVHKEFPLMRYRQLANKCGTFHITECIIRRNRERSEFDYRALCDGQSLNQQLFQGPDVTNTVQISARADSLYVRHLNMFHQVKIDVEHRNLLRFLWWDNPELKGDPVEFCMTVHSFGATSSPRCATFALKTTAD